MQLLGGFSPINAIKQAGSVLNPTGGVANYDVFSNVGAQRTPQQNQSSAPAGNTAYDGALMLNPDGTMGEYRNGQWGVSANGGGGNGSVLGGVYTNASGSGSGSTNNYADVAEANDIIAQANNVLGRLSGNRGIADQNLTGTFNTYRTGLQKNYGRDEADYNANKLSTTQANEAAKAGIDRRVASRSNSLARYMGANGGGNTQAAEQFVPYATARTGTQQRNAVNQSYGQNVQALDQSFGRYKEDYDNSLISLADQERNARSDQERQFLEQEMNARDRLSQGQSALNFAQTGNSAASLAARQNAMPGIYQILQQIDALGKQQITPQMKDFSYAAPQLAGYTNENVQGIQGVDPVQASNVSPTYQYLLKKQQEDNQNYGY